MRTGNCIAFRWLFALALTVWAPVASAAEPGGSKTGADSGLEFIDTSFENTSPVWYEQDADGVINVHLLYDHERSSPNRAAGHIHFLVHAKEGATLTLEFRNLDNIWNSRPGSVARELKTLVISPDGKQWTPVPTRALPEDRVQLEVTMPGPRLFVARVEPYRISDLDRLLASIRSHPAVRIATIGRTVQGRDLEIIQIGSDTAPNRVFIRARAHPWESGGNWVVEGLIQRLLKGDAEADRWLKQFCIQIMPMANKDGVARGGTRFNVLGRDLNRDWDQPADAELAPENHALEKWLEGMIRDGKAPHLALELHNDGGGLLHVSGAPVPQLQRHLERMAFLEGLLRKHTWFTEGRTKPGFRNSGTLGDGWLERYGIDAIVHELNCNWIAGLNDYPSARHWLAYGDKLPAVFEDYFSRASAVTPPPTPPPGPGPTPSAPGAAR